MNKLLVTGAVGFIGSHLTKILLETGYDVKSFVYYNSFNSRGWLDNFSKDKLFDIEVSAGDVRDPNGIWEAGNDAPSGEVEGKICELGSESNLIYCDNVSKNEIDSYYEQADYTVLASIPESFGLMLEARKYSESNLLTLQKD